jgi:hypothetical protein
VAAIEMGRHPEPPVLLMADRPPTLDASFGVMGPTASASGTRTSRSRARASSTRHRRFARAMPSPQPGPRAVRRATSTRRVARRVSRVRLLPMLPSGQPNRVRPVAAKGVSHATSRARKVALSRSRSRTAEPQYEREGFRSSRAQGAGACRIGVHRRRLDGDFVLRTPQSKIIRTGPAESLCNETIRMDDMIKQFAIVLGLGFALATAAIAETPSSPDQCMKAAFDLAQSAEDKKLPNDQLDRIEEMLTKMEDHCDAKQFTEAMAVAKDIEAVINKQ